jgi:glycosyltransferase involved in cell wall biosynthesis
MRIGIDARFVTRLPRRGIGNFSLHFINQIVRLDPAADFFLYVAHPDTEQALPRLRNVTVRRLHPAVYPLWENIALPLAAAKDRIDILHCLGNTAPMVWPKGIKLLLSIMDVMYLHSHDRFPPPRTAYQKIGRWYRASTVPIAARRADHIVTISNFSRQDILKSIPGLKEQQVSVCHISCDERFSQSGNERAGSQTERDSGEYILYLGAEDPRKNTLTLVRAFLSLIQKQSRTERLIISGYPNWQKSEAYNLLRSADVLDRVTFLGFTSIDDLIDLYRNAKLFVYPSLYEGFGIPILEAFASGCPVAASNVTSIPEIAGDAALLFDPRSGQEIENAMEKLLDDEVLRASLRLRGYARAAQFTWASTAQATLKIYKDLAVQQ